MHVDNDNAPNNFSLAALPVEVLLHHLAPFLCVKDLCALSCVNKSFAAVFNDHLLWKTLLFHRFPFMTRRFAQNVIQESGNASENSTHRNWKDLYREMEVKPVGLLTHLQRQSKAAIILMSNPKNTSRKQYWQAWGLILFTVIYVISPIDLIPDFGNPLIGMLDDLCVVLLLLYYMWDITSEFRKKYSW